MASGLLLVVAGCTGGYVWWWQAVLVYSGGFGLFFLGCGFRVIVGGGGVGLIPCDLGCINGS